MQTGHIVWVYGPFPCGAWPDLKMFRRKLMHMLEFGECVEADKGYMGEEHHTKVKTRKGSVARARHETINALLHNWNAFTSTFRHGIVFDSVAVITQLMIESGSLEPFKAEH